MSLLGIDVGSSSCKGVVFDYQGNVLAQSSKFYQSESPGKNMVEIDAELFWDAVVAVTGEVASAAVNDPVKALAVSSQGETFVPVDSEGNPVAPAVMNSDNRAVEQVLWWKENFGHENLYAITGVPPHAMFSLNKIMWLKKYSPDMYSRCEKFLSIGDFILSQMGFRYYTDYSLAGRTMAFDIEEKSFSRKILETAEIDGKYFPKPLPAGSVLGKLPHKVAVELRLNDNVAVVLGGHDQPCGALGSGVIDPGLACVSAGTYECITTASLAPVNNGKARSYSFNSYCHVAPDRYITMAFFPAGIVARWFIEQFCGEDKIKAMEKRCSIYDVLNEGTKTLCPGPSEICMTPHLVGACTPHWDVRATGSIVGLTPAKSRFHMYKAIYEGIGCELALNIEALEEVLGEFAELRINGGNAKSDFSVQLRADFSGKKISTLTTSETVCRGAALLAGTSIGIYSDLYDAIKQTVNTHKTFIPSEEKRRAYANQFEEYKILYSSLSKIRNMHEA